MNVRKSLIIFSLIVGIWQVQAQPLCRIEHYSSKDGLSENTVMSMLQDQKGYMWFATWDGLCRFDGYSFSSYKVKPGDDVRISNSRIDKIVEDANGFIWILLYGQDVCRFNPNKEQFVNVPPIGLTQIDTRFPVADIKCFEDGTVWLISENDGALRVQTNPTDFSMTYQLYSIKSGMLESNNVFDVFTDNEEKEWLLTDNGLSFIQQNNVKPQTFFFESDEIVDNRQSFYSHFENKNEIWFGSNKGRLWNYQKKGGRFKLVQVPTESSIQSIHQLNNNSYFIATFDDGFFTYDIDLGNYHHYNTATHAVLKSDVVFDTYLAKNGDVWIQQDLNGITQFIPSERKSIFHKVKHENLSYNFTKPEFYITEDINGHLWIHPQGGGFSYYDAEVRQLKPFFNDASSPKMLFSKRLHSMYSDKQGNLWLCTRTKGIEKVSFPQNDFQLIKPFDSKESFLWNDVRATFKDIKNNLWVATKDGRVSVFDEKLELLGYLNRSGSVGFKGIPLDAMGYCIVGDKDGVIWLGSKGQGIIKMTPRGSSKSVDTYSLKNYQYNKDDLYSLSSNNVYSLYIDSKKRIWIATFGGGLNLMSENAEGETIFINHRNNLNGYPINSCYRVRHITSDYNNNICVATTNGLITFNEDFVEPESIYFNHYPYTAGNSTSLSNNDVHYIHITPNRETYLATFGGGLNKVLSNPNTSKKQFKYYDISDGLPSDVLLAIAEDSSGNLWISTENGLSKFDPVQEQFENYNETEFGFNLSFSEGAVCKDKEGRIFFGTNKGMLHFHPDKIHKSSFVPPIIFTDLKLFNKPVKPDPESLILKTHIDATEGLEFRHFENIISISYAALEMQNPHKVQFAYRLKGFENEWNYVNDKRIASYTNLEHGDYTFQVKSTNGNGVWVDNIRALKVKVLPSFWVTSWAILIYFIVLILIIAITVFVLFTIYRLKHKVQLEEHLSDVKLKFFTDISHELRTPLTLITGPVENVLKAEDLSNETREQMQLVERNTSRMLRLINQILDFVKLRQNKMRLRIEEVEVVGFLKQVMDYFKLLSIEKNIQFELQTSTPAIQVWADVDKLEKIVFNLLSNAFKYLKDGKNISVIADEDEETVFIKVKDSGVGISDKKRQDIFNRFENIWNRRNVNQPSTGIGLSVVQDLVDMHQGTITVDSMEGNGTEFTVALKKGMNHFSEEVEMIVDESSSTFNGNELSNKTDSVLTETVSNNIVHSETVLLVEDNEDVRGFIKKLLQKTYNVLEADNGEVGLKLALSEMPDIIISDLMMPVMNGIELLQQVRNNFDISHTPFIILSAKSALDNQLEGFEKGADAYLTKPFSTSYLMARIESLVSQREKLHQYYQGNQSPKKADIEPLKPQITSHDEKFLEMLMQVMELNMDNGALVVEDLVTELAVSRSVFFKKMKALTGYSPVEFIKEMRLKRASQLILDSDHNMSQISYMVGINDSRYFSKCFKQKYGVTPTQYRNNKDANNHQDTD